MTAPGSERIRDGIPNSDEAKVDTFFFLFGFFFVFLFFKKTNKLLNGERLRPQEKNNTLRMFLMLRKMMVGFKKQVRR